jgi:hypothetical protein
MTCNQPRITAVLTSFLLMGCGQEPGAGEAATFDPKIVAAEADRGNLEPLKKLNAACRAEVKIHGKRAGSCSAKDEVRTLRKPLKPNF